MNVVETAHRGVARAVVAQPFRSYLPETIDLRALLPRGNLARR
jgi:hypothetical protein